MQKGWKAGLGKLYVKKKSKDLPISDNERTLDSKKIKNETDRATDRANGVNSKTQTTGTKPQYTKPKVKKTIETYGDINKTTDRLRKGVILHDLDSYNDRSLSDCNSTLSNGKNIQLGLNVDDDLPRNENSKTSISYIGIHSSIHPQTSSLEKVTNDIRELLPNQVDYS